MKLTTRKSLSISSIQIHLILTNNLKFSFLFPVYAIRLGMIKCKLIKEFIERKTYVEKRYNLKIIWRDALNKNEYQSFYVHKEQ